MRNSDNTLRGMHAEAEANYRAVAQFLGTSLARAWRGVNGIAHFTAEERAALTCYYMEKISARMQRLAAVLSR